MAKLTKPAPGWFETVAATLARRYRNRRHYNRREPLAELVFIILSLQTEEDRYRATYANLRKAFPTWARLRRARTARVASAIRDGGLARQKARNIVALLREIRRRCGRTSLAHLLGLPTAEAEQFLCTLPGVGIKTARCVLLYTMGAEVFPVDVHCWRVTRRLGLARGSGEKPSRSEADRIQDAVPAHLRYGLHINMVSLGRDTCGPREPECARCCVRRYCATGRAPR